MEPRYNQVNKKGFFFSLYRNFTQYSEVHIKWHYVATDKFYNSIQCPFGTEHLH